MVINSRARKGTISLLRHCAWLSAPAAFQPSSQHPHFHATGIWGQKLGKSRAVPWPGAGWLPQQGHQVHSTPVSLAHLARARKLRLTKGFSAFTCLLHPFQALPPLLRSLLHRGSYKVNLKVEDKVINVWVCPPCSLHCHLDSIYAGVQLATNLIVCKPELGWQEHP